MRDADLPVRPYERLSQVYDLEWGLWARRYVELLRGLLAEEGLARARVLDLGCGTGTLAIEMAKLGHAVVGLDASPAMIAVANRRACAGATFAVQDMSEASWEHDFDLVTCTFDAFNYLLTEPAVGRFLERVARNLSPSGQLVFDSNTEKLYSTRHTGTQERVLGGHRFRQECLYDPSAKLASTVFTFEDGKVERHLQRPWALAELAHPIAKAGLAIVAAYAGVGGEPYREDSERLVCVVRKSGDGSAASRF